MEKYYLYLVTNSKRTTIYAGMTSRLPTELLKLYSMRGSRKSFPGKNNCYLLVYTENYDSAHMALNRLKEIRTMERSELEKLIRTKNPMWEFLNKKIMDWPPKSELS